MEQLRFPIGRFQKPDNVDSIHRLQWIETIEQLPDKIKTLIEGLPDEELSKAYRPEGWNIVQLVHHLADSHMNSFVRFKLALSEDTPTIKPYLENIWAEQADYNLQDLDSSIKIIEGVHARWVRLLHSMKEGDFKRDFYHPEMKKRIPLDVTLALYAWHCKHHLGHIELAIGS